MALNANQLILNLQARGAGLTSAQVASVTASVKDLDRSTGKLGRRFKTAGSPVNALLRSLRIAQTRFILMTAGVAALTLALAALSPGLAFVIGGVVALATALGPLAALAGLAALQFKNQFEIAGTAAHELMTTFMDFRQHLERTFAPIIDVILHALARALVTLQPMIDALAPAFRLLAGAAGDAIGQLAVGLVAMTPAFTTFIRGMIPLLPKMVTLVLALLDAWLEMAIRGLPAADQLLDWMIELAGWLDKATISIDQFLHTAEGQQTLDHLVQVCQGLWEALKLIGEFTFLVVLHFKDFVPLTRDLALGLAFLWVWTKLETVAMRLYTIAATLAAIATSEFILALLADPLTWFLLALVALTAGVIYAYMNWNWFHEAIDNTWDAILGFPMAAWVAIKTAIVDGINDIIGYLNDVIVAYNGLPFGKGAEIGTIDPIGGGSSVSNAVAASRPSGPASPATPAASPMFPLSAGMPLTDQPTNIVVPVTNQLDGKVLSRSIHRATVKKKSTK